MKSFLHRIAASVVRPQSSLHPFVESIYPATTSRQTNEPQSQFETVTAPSPVEHRAERTDRPALPNEMGQQPAPSLTRPSKATAKQHPVSAEEESYQTLLPQSQTESASIAAFFSKSTSDPAFAASVSEPSTSSSVPQAASHDDHKNLHPFAAHEYSPIVVHSIPPTEPSAAIKPFQPPTLGEIQAALTRPNTRRQSPAIPPAPRTTPQQPDDIQIHIGRIEVVAVPPPAPRPAAAPARIGLNLDEYLSRRNGRLG